MIDINSLISEATKQKSPALGVYRLVKAEFLRWQKDNPGKEFDARTETKILKKMYNQRIESMKIYKQAGREELAKAESQEALFLQPFLPVEIPAEETENWTKHIIDTEFNGSVTMKDMHSILAKVKEKYPDASGKIVNNVVKSYAGTK